MVGISSAQVKELRERTGAGMMDCKRALGESNGSMDDAIQWLRSKGLAAAAKKSRSCCRRRSRRSLYCWQCGGNNRGKFRD